MERANHSNSWADAVSRHTQVTLSTPTAKQLQRAVSHIDKLLPTVFQLIKTSNQSFLPRLLNKIYKHVYFDTVHHIEEFDIDHYLFLRTSALP